LIKISIPDLIELFKLVSVGKLVGGLIHNINGPLQNIGLDLEMTRYMLKKGSDPDDDKKDSDLLKRLNRIENELERLNNIIKTASNKVIQNQNKGLLNINDFLKQEMMFFDSNLYFKHNVEKKLDLADNPPLTKNLPEHSILAINSLLQRIIEDIEENKISGLNIATSYERGVVRIKISTENWALLKEIGNKINSKKISDAGKITNDNNNTDLLLILNIFQIANIDVDTEHNQSCTKLTLTIPITE